MDCAGAFKQEKDLYVNPAQPLGKFLPQMLQIAEGPKGGFKDPHGGEMAPCIVMEKGEALDMWIQKSGDHIDMFTGLQARSSLLCYGLLHATRLCSQFRTSSMQLTHTTPSAPPTSTLECRCCRT